MSEKVGKTFRELHGEPKIDESDEPFVYHGEELTDERAEELGAEAAERFDQIRRANLVPGGKSLSGGRTHSPTVQFRVPAELKKKLEDRAAAEHRSVTKIAREAIERYLAS